MFGDDLEGHHSSRVTEWAPHSAAVLLHVVDHSHEPQAHLLQYLVHLTMVIGHSLQSRGHPAWVLQQEGQGSRHGPLRPHNVPGTLRRHCGRTEITAGALKLFRFQFKSSYIQFKSSFTIYYWQQNSARYFNLQGFSFFICKMRLNLFIKACLQH